MAVALARAAEASALEGCSPAIVASPPTTMITRLLAATLLTAALPAAAQSVPAANFSDMWWNPAESGWGISFVQHAGTSQVYAVWYTYDPREQDPATGQFKPLWFVMPGGTWTSPTTITGPVYVLNGVPFSQPGSNRVIDEVGRFTFNFANSSSGTFAYDISPPAGLSSDRPGFNLPSLAGSKQITRQSF